MVVTWPIAVGFIASVGTVCLTVLKIIQMRKQDPEESSAAKCEKIRDRITSLEKKQAVLEAHMEECRKDREELGNHIEKLSDLLIKLLTDNRD